MYSFDPLGENNSNIITNELLHKVETESVYYDCYIPLRAPFFIHNLAIYKNNESTPVSEGADYSLGLQHISGTRSTGIPLYGCILIPKYLGYLNVKITYRTIGGVWIENRNAVISAIADKNIITIEYWDNLINEQRKFPKTIRDHIGGDRTTISDLYTRLQSLIDSFSNLNLVETRVRHSSNLLNPHKLKFNQTGQNLASDFEVAQRARVNKVVTLKQVIDLSGIKENNYVSIECSHRDSGVNRPFIFFIPTQNIPNGTILNWVIEHLTSDESNFKNNSGSFTINGSHGTFVVELNNLVIMTDPVTFKVRINSNLVLTPITPRSPTLTIR